MSPDVSITRHIFKAVIISIFKEVKGSINKDLMESMTKMNKLVIFKKEVEIMKRTTWKFYD